jgi:hypothetical protein
MAGRSTTAVRSQRGAYCVSKEPLAVAGYLCLAVLAFGPLSSRELTSATRLAAIRACCLVADKYSFSTWQTAQFANYRACMFEHGQRFE